MAKWQFEDVIGGVDVTVHVVRFSKPNRRGEGGVINIVTEDPDADVEQGELEEWLCTSTPASPTTSSGSST